MKKTVFYLCILYKHYIYNALAPVRCTDNLVRMQGELYTVQTTL